MKNRLISSLIGILLLVGVSACSETPVIEIEPIEIRIMTMFGGTDPSTQTFKEQIERYDSSHPEVIIANESMTSVGDEYRRAVKTGFSTGNEADVVFFYNGADVQGIVDIGAVVPYDEIWESYPLVGKDIKPSIIDLMREDDGKVYSLPLTGFYEGLFVNKKIFESYGLDLPTNWDRLVTSIEVLNEKGITPIAGPLAQSQYLIEHFIYASAGPEDYVNDLHLDTPIPATWSEGLMNIKSFYEMNAFSKDALAVDVVAAQQMFIEGRAAMILEGSWFIGRCDEALQSQMTILPMPVAPNGYKEPGDIVAGYSAGYYISRSAYEDERKQKWMIDLVTYLTSSQSIQEIATANGGIPTSNVALEDLTELMIKGYEMVDKANTRLLPIDSRLTTEAFNHIVKEGVPYIVFGEKSAEEVLETTKIINNK